MLDLLAQLLAKSYGELELGPELSRRFYLEKDGYSFLFDSIVTDFLEDNDCLNVRTIRGSHVGETAAASIELKEEDYDHLDQPSEDSDPDLGVTLYAHSETPTSEPGSAKKRQSKRKRKANRAPLVSEVLEGQSKRRQQQL